MPYRICKTFTIESGHLLSKNRDNCRFPHGHSRTVEVVLEADELDENDMVCDLKLVKETLATVLDRFDHALCVNTADPNFPVLKRTYGNRVIEFQQTDPTSEVMVKIFYEHLKRTLKTYAATPEKRYPFSDRIRIVKVRLSETKSSWAEYYA